MAMRYAKLGNGVYRRRYNFELEREFDSPCVINIVKTNKLHYAGHMTRRQDRKDRGGKTKVGGWSEQR
jgi:hypothetical protein